MDLEGTLTPVKRKVPEDADSNDMRKVLKGEKLEGEYEIDYWSGIHLLAGESISKYSDRVEKWQNGELTRDEFEDENIRQWNNLVEGSEFETPEKFLEWYNEKFLDLRSNSGKLVELLKREGYKVGIITHTSTSLAIHAAEGLGGDFVVPTWDFDFEGGKFSKPEKAKYADDKSHIVKEMRAQGIQEIVFFGNGENDVEIAERADEAFMIENRDAVDYDSIDAVTGSFDYIVKEVREGVV